MMGWFGGSTCGCCGGGGHPCANCTAASPSYISAAVSSIANSNCNNCTSINGTYVIAQDGTGGLACRYTRPNDDLGCTDYGAVAPLFWMRAYLLVYTPYHATNVVWFYELHATVTISGSLYGSHGIWIWDSGGSAAIDCTIARTPTLWSNTYTGIGHACDFSAGGVVLTPIT